MRPFSTAASVANGGRYTVRCADGVEVSGHALDVATHARAVRLHHETAWASTLRRAVMNAVLAVKPEFFWNDKPMALTPEFRALVESRWLPACADIMDAVWTLGVVPVRLVRDVGGNLVPEVVKGRLGVDYRLATYVDSVDRRQRYIYTDAIDAARHEAHWRHHHHHEHDHEHHHDGEHQHHQRDEPDSARVRVLSGFGYDPGSDGSLRSPIAALVAEHEFFSMLRMFDARLEARRCDASLLTETTPESAGVLKDKDRFDFYADSDRTATQAEGAFARNAAELEAMRRQQMGAFGADAVEDAARRGSAALSGDLDRPVLVDKLFPLPVGHKLVQLSHPPPRGDWVALTRMHQDVTAAAYGMPRSNLVSDTAHSQTGMMVTQRSLHATVTYWREVLSSALTQLYQIAYAADDAEYALERRRASEAALGYGFSDAVDAAGPLVDTGPTAGANALTFDEMFRSAGARQRTSTSGWLDADGVPTVSVRLALPSTVANDSSVSQLVGAFAIGVIDFATLYRQLRAQIGLHTDDAVVPRDPWRAEEKLSMVHAHFGGALGALGAAGERLFPKPVEKDADGAKKKDGGKRSASSSTSKSKTDAGGGGGKKAKTSGGGDSKANRADGGKSQATGKTEKAAAKGDA